MSIDARVIEEAKKVFWAADKSYTIEDGLFGPTSAEWAAEQVVKKLDADGILQLLRGLLVSETAYEFESPEGNTVEAILQDMLTWLVADEMQQDERLRDESLRRRDICEEDRASDSTA